MQNYLAYKQPRLYNQFSRGAGRGVGDNEYIPTHSRPKAGTLKDFKSAIITMYPEAKENIFKINEHI